MIEDMSAQAQPASVEKPISTTARVRGVFENCRQVHRPSSDAVRIKWGVDIALPQEGKGESDETVL
jgi:hypothetical protein